MQADRTNTRFEFLDGIRALAASWIVLSHLWSFEQSGSRSRGGWLGLLTNWLTGYNHFAVDIFIVLSGFCLILAVARAGELPGGTAGFLRRRARRILPPYFAALVASALLALAIQRLGHQARQELTARSLLANVLLLQDVFPAQNTINAPFWSVALECKIYLLFPLLLWVQRRAGWAVALAAAGAVGYGLAAAVWWLAPGFSLYHTCPWYLLLFAMGAASGWTACRTSGTPNRAWSQVALIAFGLVLMGLLWLYPIGRADDAAYVAHLPLTDAAAGAVTAMALLLMARERVGLSPRRLRAVCELRPLVAIGAASYSLYLIHLPCLFGARIAVNRTLDLQGSPWRLLVIAAVGLPAVTAVTWGFYLAFERPFLSSRRRQRQPARTRRDAAAEAAVASIPEGAIRSR